MLFSENFKKKIIDERFSLDQYRRVEVVHLVKLQRHLSTALPSTYFSSFIQNIAV